MSRQQFLILQEFNSSITTTILSTHSGWFWKSTCAFKYIGKTWQLWDAMRLLFLSPFHNKSHRTTMAMQSWLRLPSASWKGNSSFSNGSFSNSSRFCQQEPKKSGLSDGIRNCQRLELKSWLGLRKVPIENQEHRMGIHNGLEQSACHMPGPYCLVPSLLRTMMTFHWQMGHVQLCWLHSGYS